MTEVTRVRGLFTQDLSKKLIRLFEGDRKKMESLSEQNKKLNEEVLNLRDSLAKFEKGFATMFCNSIYTDNSLNDVMSLKKNGDYYVSEELKNMFNRDEDRIDKILSPESREESTPSKVLDIQSKVRSKKNLNDLFPL